MPSLEGSLNSQEEQEGFTLCTVNFFEGVTIYYGLAQNVNESKTFRKKQLCVQLQAQP